MTRTNVTKQIWTVRLLLLLCVGLTLQEGAHLMRSHPWRDSIPGLGSMQSCTRVNDSAYLRRCVDHGYGTIMMVCDARLSCFSKEPTTGSRFSRGELESLQGLRPLSDSAATTGSEVKR